MQKLNDLSPIPEPPRSGWHMIAVIELSLSSWLVARIVPGASASR
jgi:transposase